jgi:hypothetical protein
VSQQRQQHTGSVGEFLARRRHACRGALEFSTQVTVIVEAPGAIFPLGKHVVVMGTHGQSVAQGHRSTEVNGDGKASSISANSVDGLTVDVSSALSLALSRSGLTHKQACAYMEIDTGLWSRQIGGDGHISFQRLLRLPVAFWREFLPLLAEPAGLAVSHEDIADLALMQAAVAFEALARGVAQLRRARKVAA